MATLKKAHDELFRQTPDETFQTFDELRTHFEHEKQSSHDCWQLP